MGLDIELRYVKNMAVLRCKGRIIIGKEVDDLEAKVKSALNDAPELVINLTDVNFVDSSGLGALVRYATAARARHKKIILCGVTGHVLKLFQMTRLLDLFLTFATEEEAIALHSSSPDSVAHHAGGGAGPRVLCIDSSLDMLAYLRNVLEADGHQTLASSNFPDAQLLLRSASVLLFGPNLVPCSSGSSIEALQSMAPQLPSVIVKENEDAAAMAQEILDNVKKVLPKSSS